MAQPKPSKVPKEARGLFQRQGSQNWWLRYTDPKSGKQVRTSLETHDYAEAIKRAPGERAKGFYDRKPTGRAWEDAVETYIQEKLTGANNCRKMREPTTVRVKSALLHAAKIMGVKSPEEVTLTHLEAYYKHWQTEGPMVVSSRRKKREYKRKFKIPREQKEAPPAKRTGSEATAQSLTAYVQGFLSHIGCLKNRVKFQKGVQLPKRERTLNQDEVKVLLDTCDRDDLRFVLLMGFFQGMRRGEIIACRPQWIDMVGRKINIPEKDDQKRADDKVVTWRPKNGRSRAIPLAPHALDFFTKKPELLDPNRLFILHPEAASKGLRWDPKLPFKKHVARFPGVSIHTMRHTFISHLANHGSYSVTQISAWSGDEIETIQNNYFHGAAPAGGLDAAFLPASTKIETTAEKIAEATVRIQKEKAASEVSQENALAEIRLMRERIWKLYLDNHPDSVVRELNDELINSTRAYEDRYGVACEVTPVNITSTDM